MLLLDRQRSLRTALPQHSVLVTRVVGICLQILTSYTTSWHSFLEFKACTKLTDGKM